MSRVLSVFTKKRKNNELYLMVSIREDENVTEYESHLSKPKDFATFDVLFAQ